MRPHFPSQIQVHSLNDPYDTLVWQDKILLRGNLRLSVQEAAAFLGDEMVERNFGYDFRDKSNDRLIWRVDNHGAWLPVTDPCHVHANPDDDDDRIECFPDSRGTTFLYAMHCIKNHYENKPQDWDAFK